MWVVLLPPLSPAYFPFETKLQELCHFKNKILIHYNTLYLFHPPEKSFNNIQIIACYSLVRTRRCILYPIY